MRLLWDNGVDKAALMADSEAPNFPVEHVQDPRLSTPWRSRQRADSVRVGVPEPIFQATTNLVVDPEDLSTANWTKTNCTATLTDLYAKGHRLTKVTSSVASGSIYQVVAFTVDGDKGVQAIVRQGDAVSDTQVFLWDQTAAVARLLAIINWVTKSVSVPNGKLIFLNWLDSQTVEIIGHATGVIVANQNRLNCRPSGGGTGTAYVTAFQVENFTYSTPFVAGTRAAVAPEYDFSLPAKCTIDMVVRPWFRHTPISARFWQWKIDATHSFFLWFNGANGYITLTWQDGGTVRWMISQRFDDGTSYTNSNQRIRLIVSADLTTGTGLGSRFITIPLESGSKAEDASWDGAIDTKSSAFPTLEVGHTGGVNHADSEFEYLRIYAGTLVGAVGSSAAADALLAAKQQLFALDYAPPIRASYAAVAGHNIADGATVKIQGAPHGQFLAPPLDQTFTWDADIMLKAFAEATYPYWRLAVEDLANGDGYVQVGRIYIGPHLQGPPIEPTPNLPLATTTVVTESITGQVYADRGVVLRAPGFLFPAITDAQRLAIEEMWREVENAKPVLLLVWESSLDVVGPIYCRIDQDSIPWQESPESGLMWQAALQFKEAF